MPSSIQYLHHTDGYVPTEEEFEALETEVSNLVTHVAQMHAVLLDLASEFARLRDKLEGPQ